MFEKVIEIGYLFDFYGNLLSEKQYTAIELYYIHDLSLSEISEVLDISRQGVFDTLKRAESKLYSYEEKLKLVDKSINNKIKVSKILDLVRKIKQDSDISQREKIFSDLEKTERILIDVLGNSQEGNI